MSTRKQLELGTILRRERHHAGLTLHALEQASGLPSSTISRLETGQIAAPKADHLHRLARALEIDVENLYAAAGYLIPTSLPELKPYLRAKYGLPDQAVGQIDEYFQALRNRWTNDRKEESSENPGDHAP
jgi:transcriptional regulator with XRE-family HTH domain